MNGKTKMLIYTFEDTPIFVDSTKKGDYFPSGKLNTKFLVFILQIFPLLLPSIKLNPGVEHFIYKGANLMWPGV